MALKLVDKSNVTDGALQKHIRAISGLREILDTANADYRAYLKKAKADGVNTKQLLAAMQDRKRDEGQVKIDLRDYVRCLALVNIPVHQTDLFEMLESSDEPGGEPSEHEVWEASEVGKAAGRGGQQRRDNPHPAGAALHVGWDGGWIAGQETIAAEMRPKSKVKVASTRRKRGSDGTLPLDS